MQLQIAVFAHVRTYARLCVWLEPTAARAHVQQSSPIDSNVDTSELQQRTRLHHAAQLNVSTAHNDGGGR